MCEAHHSPQMRFSTVSTLYGFFPYEKGGQGGFGGQIRLSLIYARYTQNYKNQRMVPSRSIILIKKQFFGFQETNPLIRFYFLLLILWPLGAAQAQDGGEIISALGMVEVLRDGRWQKAAVGETLNAGETVRTGADSRAALQLSSGSQLKAEFSQSGATQANRAAFRGLYPDRQPSAAQRVEGVERRNLGAQQRRIAGHRDRACYRHYSRYRVQSGGPS